jgi:SagB-type dehydrogenase family enzyme
VSFAGLRESLVDPGIADSAAALVVVTGVFWRSRFKYGLRGYRFALLEAGHLMQNAVLAATDLELDALPIGGFYDALLDRLVGADGLDEASLYALALAGSR